MRKEINFLREIMKPNGLFHTFDTQQQKISFSKLFQ